MDIGARTKELVDASLTVGRADDAVTAVIKASRHGHSEAGELLCELAEKLMRSGHEHKARVLWDTARADFPDDVWAFVQAGIEYHDLGDHPTALSWLTPGVELALPQWPGVRTGPARATPRHLPDHARAAARRPSGPCSARADPTAVTSGPTTANTGRRRGHAATSADAAGTRSGPADLR
jgi:hypothetical protein